MNNFSILHYDYVNTGGNTMVGIFTVWLPEEKRVVYALTNEEGCNLSVVDYISNDIAVDDYADLIIENISFDLLVGTEKYFELYRHCLNAYIKSDCRHFGITVELPFILLSDELQAQVTPAYIDWLHGYGNGCLTTDGERIIIDPDFPPYVAEEDGMLTLVKQFKAFHDAIAGNEEYYSEDYVLSIADKTVHLPFMADVWEAINDALNTTIENW